MLEREISTPTVRVLDIGCGDARLLAYLAQTLPSQNRDRKFEFYGFEVGDIGWHGDGYLNSTVEFLNEHAPGFSWKDRILVFSVSDCWPYGPASFDIIVSNQVLEHVHDHSLLFAEVRRCLVPAGVSVHVFPLGDTIYEFHAHMPVVHWIRQPEGRRKLMLLFARIGFTRKYHEEMHFRGWTNLDEFAAIYSDVIGSMTNYKSSREISELARKAGLTPEFSYTKNFFLVKMLSMLGRTLDLYSSPNWFDRVSFPLLKRLASVTLILRQA